MKFLMCVVVLFSGMSCFSMEEIALEVSSLVDGLTSASNKDFKSELILTHEQLVSEGSDDLGIFIQQLIESLHNLKDEEKLNQMIDYYQSQLTDFGGGTLFNTYVYLKSLEEYKCCCSVLSTFYVNIKCFFTNNSCKSLEALLSPRDLESDINGKENRASKKVGKIFISKLVNKRKLLSTGSRTVSPRLNQLAFSDKEEEFESVRSSPRTSCKNIDKVLIPEIVVKRKARSQGFLKRRQSAYVIGGYKQKGDISSSFEEKLPHFVRKKNLKRSQSAIMKNLNGNGWSEVSSAQGSPEFARKKKTVENENFALEGTGSGKEEFKKRANAAPPQKKNELFSRRRNNRSQSLTMKTKSHSLSGRFTSQNSSNAELKKKAIFGLYAERVSRDSFRKGDGLVRALQKAATSGDVDILQKSVITLKEMGKLDILLPSGKTIISWATEKQKIALTLMLLKSGADINCFDKRWKTPLLIAAAKGDDTICTLFIRKGANVTVADDNGRTALHYAAKNGLCDIISQLLEKDPSLLEAQDSCHFTALMVAAIYDMDEAVTHLLAKGADAVMLADNNGNTGLHHCAASKNCSTSVICEQISFESVDQLNAENGEGFTPFMSAVYKKNIEICAWLLKKEVTVDSVDEFGNTLLHICVRSDFVECPEQLFTIRKKNNAGYTPFMLAVMDGHVVFCRKFLEQKYELNERDNAGNTLLMLAVMGDHIEICEMLLTQNISSDISNDEGDTVFHILAKSGKFQILKKLLEHYAKCGSEVLSSLINMRNNLGNTALICAVQNGHDTLVQLFIQYSADGQCLNYKGKTAYEIAMEDGLAVLFSLVEHKCSYCGSNHSLSEKFFICDVKNGRFINVKMHVENNILLVDEVDEEGIPVLVIAVNNDHEAIANLLVDSGAYKGLALEVAEEKKYAKVVAYLNKLS